MKIRDDKKQKCFWTEIDEYSIGISYYWLKDSTDDDDIDPNARFLTGYIVDDEFIQIEDIDKKNCYSDIATKIRETMIEKTDLIY